MNKIFNVRFTFISLIVFSFFLCKLCSGVPLFDPLPAWAEKLPIPTKPIPTFINTSKKIIAIGDLYGNYKKTIQLMKVAKIIDNDLNWIAKNIIVIQVGDILDRGEEEEKLLEFLLSLPAKARLFNSEFYMLHGNHEIMNFDQDFRYAPSTKWKTILLSSDNKPNCKFPVQNRSTVFKRGGKISNLLASNNIAMVIGDTLFVHAGLTPKYCKYVIEKMNKETREWLLRKTMRIPDFLQDQNGPIWTRRYSNPKGIDYNQELKTMLKK